MIRYTAGMDVFFLMYASVDAVINPVLKKMGRALGFP